MSGYMCNKVLMSIGFFVMLLAMTISGQSGGYTGQSAFAQSNPSRQSIDRALLEGFAEAARQLNAHGPVMVDGDTRRDWSAAGPGPRLTYYHTFPEYSSFDIDRAWLMVNLKSEVREGVCRSEEMRASLDYGGTYVYSYSGNDGVEVARFELSKSDCGY